MRRRRQRLASRIAFSMTSVGVLGILRREPREAGHGSDQAGIACDLRYGSRSHHPLGRDAAGVGRKAAGSPPGSRKMRWKPPREGSECSLACDEPLDLLEVIP